MAVCSTFKEARGALARGVPFIAIGVTIGSVAHPMEEKHYIEWIELIADGKAYRQFLNPGDAPTATFYITAEKLTARELCNLHGQWSAQG